MQNTRKKVMENRVIETRAFRTIDLNICKADALPLSQFPDSFLEIV